MEIKTLKGIDTKSILNAFNESFSDYFIPFKLSEEQLITKMLLDKTDLKFSVGVFEKRKLIAFILHGIDKVNDQKVIYNGGTGVIPEKRGLGLTKQMYRFILPILKKERINKLILEVITENIQAITAYEKSGFKVIRDLLCYKGDVEVSHKQNKLLIKELQRYNWDIMESFWDIYPTWQNSKSVVNELKSKNISLGAYLKDQLVGYIIYSPTSKRIQQVAVSKDFRRIGVASALFSELIKTHGNTFSIINVDKSSKSLNSFLKKIRFKINLEQLEMELRLVKPIIQK